MVEDGHWVRWHADYDDHDSWLSRRLVVVQRRLRLALDATPPGPIRVISVCAGQGRDLIGVLDRHPRRSQVTARLVELDPRLVGEARAKAEDAGLPNVDVIEGDASTTTAYAGAVPADVILVCGVFGNVTDADIHRTVAELPRLSAPGASVIWTRHRRAPDMTPAIRAWFTEAGFEEVAFDTEEGATFGVGSNRFVCAPKPFRLGRRMFTVVGDGTGTRLSQG